MFCVSFDELGLHLFFWFGSISLLGDRSRFDHFGSLVKTLASFRASDSAWNMLMYKYRGADNSSSVSSLNVIPYHVFPLSFLIHQ